MKKYKMSMSVDPVLNSKINEKNHDFVHLECESTSKECLEWFRDFCQDRLVCVFEIEELDE